MFAITINEKGGETKRLEFDKSEVTIGRVQGNDIILPKGNVSKRHSRIVFKDGLGYDSGKLIESVEGQVGIR